MTAIDVPAVDSTAAGPVDGLRSRTRRSPSGDPTRREPYLVWCGALVCLVLAIAALGGIASAAGRLHVGHALPALAVGEPGVTSQLPDRVSCAEFGTSDLRSPAEGVWYQSNCVASPAPALAANVTNCNRTSLDAAQFTLVAPGLYVTNGAQASARYLWYASSETCFDLVSTRAVTAVCADETVTFNWSTKVCSAHGGVLAWVNGR